MDPMRLIRIVTFTALCITVYNANAQEEDVCEFPKYLDNFSSQGNIPLKFDPENFICILCDAEKKFGTLVEHRRRFALFPNLACRIRCNGRVCGRNYTCTTAEELEALDGVVPGCGGPGSIASVAEESITNQIPVIIGFSVGGLMLLVIIAGICLGRRRQGGSPSSSDVATTPVSMSYTADWISNRVQESISEDDLYKCIYDDKKSPSYSEMLCYRQGSNIIKIDDSSSLSITSSNPNSNPCRPIQDYSLWSADFTTTDGKFTEKNNNVADPFDDHVWSLQRHILKCSGDFHYDHHDHKDENTMVICGCSSEWSDASEWVNSWGSRTPESRRSSRKLSVPTLRASNLHHVFVDVHRCMTCSFEKAGSRLPSSSNFLEVHSKASTIKSTNKASTMHQQCINKASTMPDSISNVEGDNIESDKSPAVLDNATLCTLSNAHQLQSRRYSL